MTLHFQPHFGQTLICDFPSEFRQPEMIKRRPVICISPKFRNRYGIATVVPLSTTEPTVTSGYCVEINLETIIYPKFNSLKCWAKCDMLYSLSYSRLSVPYMGKDSSGKRVSNSIILDSGTMCDVLTGVLAGMGVDGSVRYENSGYCVFDFKTLL